MVGVKRYVPSLRPPNSEEAGGIPIGDVGQGAIEQFIVSCSRNIGPTSVQDVLDEVVLPLAHATSGHASDLNGRSGALHSISRQVS